MKVSVNCQINYLYEVELPEDISVKNEDDFFNYIDAEDPVYRQLCSILGEAHLNFEGNVISIVDNDSDKVLYAQ